MESRAALYLDLANLDDEGLATVVRLVVVSHLMATRDELSDAWPGTSPSQLATDFASRLRFCEVHVEDICERIRLAIDVYLQRKGLRRHDA